MNHIINLKYKLHLTTTSVFNLNMAAIITDDNIFIPDENETTDEDQSTLICFSYSCSSLSEDVIKRLRYSNKIILPPNILYQINKNEKLENEATQMFFKIWNPIIKFGAVCGVEEFSAPPGVCHVPYHIMELIGISEGENIEMQQINPAKGSYIKIQPHKTEFIQLKDPKKLLEEIMSKNYPVISSPQTIIIQDPETKTKYLIDILETKPDTTINITNANINVDFEAPKDYESPKQPSPQPSPQHLLNKKVNAFSRMTSFVPFSGKGHKLGSK